MKTDAGKTVHADGGGSSASPDLTELTPNYRVDLRPHVSREYQKFVCLNPVRDWSVLAWKDVGKPYEVTTVARDRKAWEQAHDARWTPIRPGLISTALFINGSSKTCRPKSTGARKRFSKV
ncbi:hypothetical protein CM49_06669 [Paenibacillus sp. P1XP2]|nr:hypothetical protein CM49_06669 [Paenibacillus sp. P1XP2]